MLSPSQCVHLRSRVYPLRSLPAPRLAPTKRPADCHPMQEYLSRAQATPIPSSGTPGGTHKLCWSREAGVTAREQRCRASATAVVWDPPPRAMRRGRIHRRRLVATGRHHAWPTARSNFCGAKLHWIEVVTFEKTVKFGAVPPSQTRRLTHVPVGDFQEPHQILLLKVMLGII